jgi:hypothetical protein
MGLNPNAWTIRALTGAVPFLSIYDGSPNYSKLHFWLLAFGLRLTILMLAILRRTAADDTLPGSMVLIRKFSA